MSGDDIDYGTMFENTIGRILHVMETKYSCGQVDESMRIMQEFYALLSEFAEVIDDTVLCSESNSLREAGDQSERVDDCEYPIEDNIADLECAEVANSSDKCIDSANSEDDVEQFLESIDSEMQACIDANPDAEKYIPLDGSCAIPIGVMTESIEPAIEPVKIVRKRGRPALNKSNVKVSVGV